MRVSLLFVVVVLIALAALVLARRKKLQTSVQNVQNNKTDDLQRLHTISSSAAVSLFTTPTQLIEMGDTYAAGVYPRYAPDRDVARALFVRAATHPDARALAMAKMETLKHTDADVAVRTPPVRPLPDTFATQTLQVRVVADPPQNNRPATNLQSVHDHAVTRSVNKTLTQLNTTTPVNYEEVAAEIRKHTLEEWKGGDAVQKNRALGVIDAIMGTDADHKLDSVGFSEKEAMRKVWTTISLGNHELRDNVRETFVMSLADSVDPASGAPVCSTGRVVKMVAALDGTGILANKKDTVDMYAVRQELMNMAAKVRGSHGEDEDEGVLRSDFRARATEVYVDGLGIEKDVLEPLIQEMEHGF